MPPGPRDTYDAWVPRLLDLLISATCLYLLWWEVHRPAPNSEICVLLLAGAIAPWSRRADKILRATGLLDDDHEEDTTAEHGERGRR